MTLSTKQRFEAKLALEERDGITCATDGCERTDTEVDHIVSVAAGGTDSLENLQLLCRSCNASKGAGAVIVGSVEDANAEYLRALQDEGAQLYLDVLATFKRHVYLSQEWPFTVLALWTFVAQAGFREYLSHLPLLSVTSPRPEMGKSIVTRMLSGLIPDSVRYSTLSSWKVLPRGHESVYILDEVEEMKLWRGEQHSYINQTVEAEAIFPLNEPTPDGGWAKVDHPAFTAVVLGGLNQQLAEDTLTRCIRIVMEDLPEDAHIHEYDHHRSPESQAVAELGQRIAAWAVKAGPFLEADIVPGVQRKRAIPSFLRSRARDKWSSLFGIATLIGPPATTDVLMAALDYRSVEAEGKVKSQSEEFVECLAAVLSEGEAVSIDGFVPTKDLVHVLEVGYPELYGSKAERTLKGQRLGQLLRSVGAPESTQVRIPGQRNSVRGYPLKALREVCARAVPSGNMNRTDHVALAWRQALHKLATGLAESFDDEEPRREVRTEPSPEEGAERFLVEWVGHIFDQVKSGASA